MDGVPMDHRGATLFAALLGLALALPLTLVILARYERAVLRSMRQRIGEGEPDASRPHRAAPPGRPLALRWLDPGAPDPDAGGSERLARALRGARRAAVVYTAAGIAHACVPVVHGGALATLLDNVMGWATYSLLEDSENFATADLQIQFLRGARPGLLKARGSVLRRTRALAFCQAEASNGEGQVVARGSATCSIFRVTLKLLPAPPFVDLGIQTETLPGSAPA